MLPLTTGAQRAAYRTYLAMTGVRSLLFWTAFITGSIYYIRMVGLGPLHLVLVGTVLELTTFLLEIPTGVVADAYSRKLSVAIGFAVIGAGFVLQGAIPTFGAILAAQLLYGGGWTFISGAEDAWLADEIGTEALPHAYLRGKQVSLAASFVGVFASVALASLRLNLPFLLSGAALVAVAAVLWIRMPETNFHRTAPEERGSWRRMAATLADGLKTIRVSPLLWTIMALTLLFGVSREGIDRLWEAHLLDAVELPVLGDVDTIVWFGIINAAAMLAALVLSIPMRRLVNRFTDRRAVLWLVARNVLLGAAVIAFAVAGSFTAIVVAFVAIYSLRELGDSLQSAWVNRSIDSRSRATVLSTISQMDAIGQGCGGPAIGAVGERFGLRASMLMTGALMAPVILLLLRTLRFVTARTRPGRKR